CAKVLCPGAPVARASIDIRSADAGTIKADTNLFDASGRTVMQVRELRLKRTRLRQQVSLEARSFHYQTVESLTAAQRDGHRVDGGAIRDEPALATKRNKAMRARLRANHGWDRYREILASEPHTTKGLLNVTGTTIS